MSTELGDLRGMVSHALEKPFIRLKGMNLVSGALKKIVKLNSPHHARAVKNATSYLITNELLDLLIPMIVKGTTRQFVNAAINANPPGQNIWLEWDHHYFHKELNRLFPERARQTISQGFVDRIGLAGAWIKNMRAYPNNKSKYGYDHESSWGPKSSSQYKKTGFGTAARPGDEYTFHEYQGYYLSSPPYADQNEVCALPVGLSTDMFSKSSFIDQKLADVSDGWFDGEGDGTSSLTVDYLLMRDVRPLQNTVTNDDEAAQHLADYVTLRDRFHFHNHPMRDLNAETIWADCDPQYARFFYPVVIAALSLLNYDWVVREPDTRTRSVNNIAANVTPFDSYYTVAINLPKEKAAKLINKQPRRIREFGTRQHEVRGHWRVIKREGYPDKRTWVRAHKRGNEKLGVIVKDYVLKHNREVA